MRGGNLANLLFSLLYSSVQLSLVYPGTYKVKTARRLLSLLISSQAEKGLCEKKGSLSR